MRLRTLLLAAAVSVAAAVLPAVADPVSVTLCRATQPCWGDTSVADPAAGGELFDVSCATTTTCVAVGLTHPSDTSAAMLRETWNGRAWTASVGGQGLLTGVSCPTSTFCMAVGEALPNAKGYVGEAQRWDGTRWGRTSLALTHPGSGLRSVSCSSASFCLAVGGAGETLVERWDGTRWTSIWVRDTRLYGARLEALSCTSPTWCMVVGNFSASSNPVQNRIVAALWNGRTLVPMRTGPSTAFQLTDISCPSSTSCLGTTTAGAPGQGVAVAWDGRTWQARIPPTHGDRTAARFSGVSCASAGHCLAVGARASDEGADATSDARFLSGSSWTDSTTDDTGPRGYFRAASCAAADSCMAVGGYYPQPGKPPRPMAEQYSGLPLHL